MIIIKSFSGRELLKVNADDLSRADLSHADLSRANLSNADFFLADLSLANLSRANLSGANLDFSCLSFSCKSLYAKFDQKHIIQMLYHAAKPCENNKIKLDFDVEKLLNSKAFKKVVNKFHRCDSLKFLGVHE